MGKSKKTLLLILILLLSTFIFASCGGPNHIPTRDLTKSHILFYDGDDLVASRFVYDSDKSLPIGPEKEGLSFDGWYYKNVGEKFSKPFKEEDFKQEIAKQTLQTPSIEVEAKYVLGSYIITFDGKYPDAFTNAKGDKSQFEYFEYDRTTTFDHIVLPINPSHGVCEFKGWFKDKTLTQRFESADVNVKPTKNYTLYAKWFVPTYTITFDDVTAPGIEPLTIEYESAITLPSPTKPNALFAYFYYLEDGVEKQFTLTHMPAYDIKLYAKWVSVSQVNYYLGSTLLYTEENHPVDAPVILEKANVGSACYLPDYVFEGWYNDPELKIKATDNISLSEPSINLYGKYNQRGGLELCKQYENSSVSSPIVLNSLQDLIDIVDYAFTFNVTIHYKFDYIANIKENNITELAKAVKQCTCVNKNYSAGYSTSSYGVMVFNVSTERQDINTPSPSTKIVEQKHSGLVPIPTHKRDKNFDNFKYNNYPEFVKPVRTSDQLFYVLQKGWKPVCVKNSVAEDMLNKAKTVLRDIIDDSMSDFDKLYAIYCWLIINVNYDHLAAKISQNDANYALNCAPWYLEGVFNGNHFAVCDGISKALTVLARIEGLNVVRVTGPGHAWNKAYIDVDGNGAENAKWYSLDATWDDLSIQDSNGDYLYQIPVFDNFLIADNSKKMGSGSNTQYYPCENYLDEDMIAKDNCNVAKFIILDGSGNNLVVKHIPDMQAVIHYVANNMKVNNYKLAYAQILFDNSLTNVKELIRNCEKDGLLITEFREYNSDSRYIQLQFKKIA